MSGTMAFAADKCPTDLQDAGSLRQALEDELIWDDASRHDQLLEYLDAAQILRDVSLVPVLSKHLGYNRYSVRPVPPSTVPSEVMFPAWAAMVGIGTPAVPSLLEIIRATDYTDSEHYGGRKHALALYGIQGIYDPGGHGASLTKLLVEVAAAQAEGVQRERLLYAASNPLLVKLSEQEPGSTRPQGVHRPLEINPDGVVDGVSLQDLLADLNVAVRAVQTKLEEQLIWSDLTRRDELVECVQVAGQLRAPELIPALSEHLAYTPIEGNKREELALEERYPVFVALAAIGVPAVPALLQRLSVVDPDDQLGTGARQHDLAVRCLVEIYSPGGHGRELAHLRIKLAAEEATGPFQERLLRAAKHAMLDQNREQPKAE
ncbi:MAG: hypothetical protein K2Y37_08060 [Pirellulales bacterium]|nr:hypothetical protein [Pirellulales bacterium]